ncbi:MAG TPA: GAF domain-containing sensor histidine kinase [Gemmatimonadaceae bacterium]|nr:GAF domain-containing sensor histidine kinase [Gemmatimonadaceae bacterium]
MRPPLVHDAAAEGGAGSRPVERQQQQEHGGLDPSPPPLPPALDPDTARPELTRTPAGGGPQVIERLRARTAEAEAAQQRAESRERWASFLVEAGALLASSLDFETTLQSVARLAVPRVADWCVVHVVEDDGHVRRAATAHALPRKDALARELAERYPLDPAHPFTALAVLETGKPAVVPEVDVVKLRDAVRDEGELALLSALAPCSEIAVPLIVHGRVLGALNLLLTEPGRRYGDADLGPAEELAHLAAFAVDNARLYRAAQTEIDERRRAEAGQRFLVEASTALASSLDYEQTLKALARLAVPFLADACSVDIIEADGRLHRLTIAHRNPAIERIAAELVARYPVAKHPDYPSVRVTRTGRRWRSESVPDDALAAIAAGDETLLAGLRALAPRSLLCVPLVARHRVLGAIMLVRSREGPPFSHAETTLAEELARRAALAVDNARLYENALAANQAKGDFLAVMSHELRTPLTTVIGYAELLADGVSGPVSATQQKQLTRIQLSAQHLLQLIEQILSFARIEAGREQVRIERMDAAGVAGEAALLVEPAVSGRALALTLRLPHGALTIDSDPGKVRQILVNLLSNAIKFTDHGEVGLAARRDETTEGVIYEVWDTGIGIAAEHLEHIFDPFWQVEQKVTRKAGGTGLGLSVVRHLARLLGGDVRVESEEGRGTRFTVSLPLRAELR